MLKIIFTLCFWLTYTNNVTRIRVEPLTPNYPFNKMTFLHIKLRWIYPPKSITLRYHCLYSRIKVLQTVMLCTWISSQRAQINIWKISGLRYRSPRHKIIMMLYYYWPLLWSQNFQWLQFFCRWPKIMLLKVFYWSLTLWPLTPMTG